MNHVHCRVVKWRDLIIRSDLCIPPWSRTKGQDAELQSLAAELSDHLSNGEKGKYTTLLELHGNRLNSLGSKSARM